MHSFPVHQCQLLAWILQMVFMGRGFTSREQDLVCAFDAVVCKIQARKHYIKSLTLVLKDKKAVSLKVKGPLYSCLLTAHLPTQSRTLNKHICGSPVQKSKVIPLRISIALLCSKRRIAELPLRVGLIRASQMHEQLMNLRSAYEPHPLWKFSDTALRGQRCN